MVRTVLNNPFAPGSGVVPQIWVGRDHELADIGGRLVPRRSALLFERGRTYLGDPGMGKSVLVNRIAEERRQDGDLVADPLRLARGRDPLAALAGALRTLISTGERVATELRRAARRVGDVGLLGVSVGRAPVEEDRYAAMAELLVQLGHLARARESLLVIRVDEVQNATGDGLSQLLTLLGDLLEHQVTATVLGEQVQQHLPVIVLLSGLPQFAQQAADAGATFSRRFATFDLEPFTDDEVRAALTFAFAEGVEVLTEAGPDRVMLQHGAIDALVRHCLGDPFLFQLAGAAAWDAGTDAIITAQDVADGWGRARREVEAHVRGRTAGLTDLQLQVLTATAVLTTAGAGGGGEGMAVDGSAIARELGRQSSSRIGSTLQALVTKRLLARDPGGYRVVSRAVARHLVREISPS
ncbi:hypothetical protein BH23ACT9_BH23ACT9_39830 [soil metagenome]